MNKLLTWGSILVAVVIGGRALANYMSRSANENAATTRVETFLRGIAPGGDFQAGFSMWESGATNAIRNLSQDQYNAEVARLTAWLAARGFGSRIERYEMNGATLVAPSEGLEDATVEVACTINGKPATILAVKGQRLEWVD